jgi:hypothetical protein
VVKLLNIGSVQEVEWVRMPAERLAIGPSLIPREHVIVSTPPCRHLLLYTSPTTTFTTSIRSNSQITAIQLFQRTSRRYNPLRLPDSSAQQARNSSRHSPSSPSRNHTNSLPSPSQTQTTCLIDRNRPPVPFLPPSTQSALPIHL